MCSVGCITSICGERTCANVHVTVRSQLPQSPCMWDTGMHRTQGIRFSSKNLCLPSHLIGPYLCVCGGWILGIEPRVLCHCATSLALFFFLRQDPTNLPRLALNSFCSQASFELSVLSLILSFCFSRPSSWDYRSGFVLFYCCYLAQTGFEVFLLLS